MRLTEKTEFKDVFGIVSLMSVNQCEEASEWACRVLALDYHSLTISDAADCLRGDFSVIGVEGSDMLRCKASQYFWAWGFANVFMPKFMESLNRLVVQPTAEERMASEACLPCSWYETQVSFALRFFNLHSFDEAERITLDQLLLGHKVQFNDIVFARKFSEIQKKQKR